MNCKKCGNPLPENANFCNICDTVQDEALASQPMPRAMSFYKFITYVFLPINILGGLAGAILYGFGLIRNFDYTATAYGEWGTTYETVPFLKALDIPMGIGYLGLAVFASIAMIFLLQRKKNAVSCFFASCLTTMMVLMAFSFINYAVQLSIGEQTEYTAPSGYLFYTLLILALILGSLFLWLCHRYFKVRQEYFDQ